MSKKRPEKIWGLVYNMMKSVNNDVPTILRTLDQVLSQKPSFDMRFDHDSIIPRSFVIWLVNQLLSFTGRPLSNRIRKQNVQLQKKLLTFCYLHMPQLFETLLMEYNKTLTQLSEVCFTCNNNNLDDSEPRTVSTFITEDIQFFKEIDEKFVFEEFSVTLDMSDITMQCIIEILAFAMSISFNVHRKLFEDTLAIVLVLFPLSDVYTKLECLDFGVKFFENLYEFDQNLTRDYGILFEFCQLIWENLANWIGFGFVDEYGLSQAISTSMKLFKCEYRTFLTDKIDVGVLEGLTNSCEAILRAVIKDQDRLGNRVELKTKVIDFILELNRRIGCQLPAQSFLQLIKSENMIAKLFGIQEDGNSAVSSALTKALRGSKGDHSIIKNILNTIIELEHKSVNGQQLKIHSESTNLKELHSKNIQSEVVFSCHDLQASLETFLQSVQANCMSSNEFCDFVEICGLLLQSTSVLTIIGSDLQTNLIDLILFYLRHHSKIKQKLSLNVPSLSRIEDNAITASLDALANVTHQNLSAQASSYLHKSVKEFICAMYPVCQSEPIKGQLNEKLLNFVANSVISIKLIVCHMLPTIVKSPINSNILVKIKCICCSALGNVYVFKIPSKDQPFAYECLCEQCEKPNREDFVEYLETRSAVLMQQHPQSFEESSLNFVLNSLMAQNLLTNKHAIFAINHFTTSKLENQVLCNVHLEPKIIKALLVRTSSSDKEFPLLPKVGALVLQKVHDSLERGNEEEQLENLHLIFELANIEGIPEVWLFHFFKMTFFFMICCESAVGNEAAKCATEMCSNYGVDPMQLWYWYKRECLSLVVDLTTHVYLKKGQGLLRTLNAVS